MCLRKCGYHCPDFTPENEERWKKNDIQTDKTMKDMKTEEKEERMKKAGVEVMELLVRRVLTNGEGIITLTHCLASLIANNPDKRKRDNTLAATVILLTESMARLEKAFEADALKRPEEGGGE